jgi:SHAQKYF class myb-like DNA-binding protein
MEPKVNVEPHNHYFRPYKITKEYKLESYRMTCPVSFQISTPTPHQIYPKTQIENTVSAFCSNLMEGDSNDSLYLNRGEWNEKEHNLFLKGYKKYQKNWALIAKEFVHTRTRQQVRNHAVKFFLKEEKAGRAIEV